MLNASGTSAEFRPQYVVYAELQWALGRTVETAAGSGLHPVTAVHRGDIVEAATTGRLDCRLMAADLQTITGPSLVLGRHGGRRLLLQAMGQHDAAIRGYNA